MAIANFKPTKEPEVDLNVPKIAPNSYKPVSTDTKSIPVDRLTSFIGGSNWSVDLFIQRLTTSNDLREVDPSESAAYQQYTRINNYVIKVDNPLESSFDSEKSITIVEGGGTLPGFVIPNVGDYFTSEAGLTQKGLFRIKEVERLSLNQGSAYRIQYDLVDFITEPEASDLYNSLVEKTVMEYVFEMDRFRNGQYPILSLTVRDQVMSMREKLQHLMQYYLDVFYDFQLNRFLLPYQDQRIYDPYLSKYVTKFYSPSKWPQIVMVQTDMELDRVTSQDTLFTRMLDRNYNLMKQTLKEIVYISINFFSSNYAVLGFLTKAVEYVAYPKDPDVTRLPSTYAGIDYSLAKTVSEINHTVNYDGVRGEDLILQYEIEDGGTIPLDRTIHGYDTYVLSPSFYQGLPDLSVLEILVRDYLKHQTLDEKMLTAYVDSFYNLSRLDQFYKGPLLITLMLEFIRKAN